MMKAYALFAMVIAAGCGSKDEGKAVVTKIGELEKAMCACKDEACAVKVRSDWTAYSGGGTMKKPTDKQMSEIMDAERRMSSCETKFVLDESGKLQLDYMKKNLLEARAKVGAGQYSGATLTCSPSDGQDFKTKYGAFAESKPDIKAFLDEYTAYCTMGMHVDVYTKAVEKAEAARAAKAEGNLPECSMADVMLAEVKLKELPDGPAKLAPLKERWAKACP